METTMSLYHKAMEKEPNSAYWCEQLQASRSALAVAKTRGRLSPTMAGNLARLLGEDVAHWIAVAALEAEPDSYGKNKLVSVLDDWRKR